MHLWIVVVLGVAFVSYSHVLGELDIRGDIAKDAIAIDDSGRLSVDTLQASPSDEVRVTQTEQKGSDAAGVGPVDDVRIAEKDAGVVTVNATEDDDEVVDGSASNSSTTEKAGKRARPTKVDCLRRNETDMLEDGSQDLTVQILNHTSHPDLFKTVPNATVAPCSLILFYAPFCPFSASAAPHYNAVARLYPDVPCVAIDASTHVSLNARYGTVALPTLYLFHNGHPVAKFNETAYTLDNFVAFVRKYASLEPVAESAINVTSADFIGPLSSEPVREADWLLWLSWVFVLACSGYGITKSSLWHRLLESLRNNWQEAEAQHEHAE